MPGLFIGGKTEEWKAKGGVGQQALYSIGVGAGGGQGVGPPLSGLGDNPPTFCCNIGNKYQNLLRIA